LVLTVTAAPAEPLAAEVEDVPDEYGPDFDVVCAAAGVAAELVLDVLALFLLLPHALSANAAIRADVTARCFATSTPVVCSICCLLRTDLLLTDARPRATFPLAGRRSSRVRRAARVSSARPGLERTTPV
jgi:hypothetical protein